MGFKIYDLAMVISIISLLIKKNKLKVRQSEMISFILFISYIIFVWFLNGYYADGIIEISRYILSFITLVLFFNLKPDLKSIIKFIPIISAANILQAIILNKYIAENQVSSFMSKFVNVTLFNSSEEIRYNGFFTDPNKFLCFFFFLFVIYEYFYNIDKKSISNKHRLITHIILFSGIIISLSRTALISLSIYFLLLLLKKIFYKNKKMMYTFIVFVCIILALFVLSKYDYFTKLINSLLVNSSKLLGRERTAEINTNIAEDGRYIIWNMTYSYIKLNPLIGYGPQSFLRLLPYPTHNTFITILLDYGLIGCILFTMLIKPLFYKIKFELLIPFIVIPSLMLDLSNFRLFYIVIAILISKYYRENQSINGNNI